MTNTIRPGRPKKNAEPTPKATIQVLARLTPGERGDLSILATARGLSISRMVAHLVAEAKAILDAEVEAKRQAAEEANKAEVARLEAIKARKAALAEHRAWASGEALIQVDGNHITAKGVHYLARITGPHPTYHLSREFLGERGCDPSAVVPVEGGIFEIKYADPKGQASSRGYGGRESKTLVAVHDGLVLQVDYTEVKRAATGGAEGLSKLAQQTVASHRKVTHVENVDALMAELLVGAASVPQPPTKTDSGHSHRSHSHRSHRSFSGLCPLCGCEDYDCDCDTDGTRTY